MPVFSQKCWTWRIEFFMLITLSFFCGFPHIRHSKFTWMAHQALTIHSNFSMNKEWNSMLNQLKQADFKFRETLLFHHKRTSRLMVTVCCCCCWSCVTVYVALLLEAVVMPTDAVETEGAEVKVTMLMPPEVTTELPATWDKKGLFTVLYENRE